MTCPMALSRPLRRLPLLLLIALPGLAHATSLIEVYRAALAHDATLAAAQAGYRAGIESIP